MGLFLFSLCYLNYTPSIVLFLVPSCKANERGLILLILFHFYSFVIAKELSHTSKANDHIGQVFQIMS